MKLVIYLTNLRRFTRFQTSSKNWHYKLQPKNTDMGLAVKQVPNDFYRSISGDSQNKLTIL